VAADLKSRLENLGYSKLLLQATDNDSIKKNSRNKTGYGFDGYNAKSE
jgi:hypothetical protein